MTDSQMRRLERQADNGPLVSVVMPFLNPGAFIREAIESVLDQNYRNWELLLVDDGSTDESPTIAQAYVHSHPARVRYLQHPQGEHRGTGESRNVGLRAARGELIAFLDADDVYLPHKLDEQVALLVRHPNAGLVYDRTLYWHSWTGRPEHSRKDNLTYLGVEADRLYSPPSLLTLILRNEDAHPCICSLLLRTTACEEVRGFEDSLSNMYEDTAFLAKLLIAAPTFVSGGCSAKYRQHDNSICHRWIRTGRLHTSEPNVARLAYLEWLEAYLGERQVRNPTVRRALRRALWPYRHPQVYRSLRPFQSLARAGRRVLAGIGRRLRDAHALLDTR